MRRLEGKTAIITGGARGMGAATSRLFAAEGANVVIADILDAEGQALAAELGNTTLFQHHDVSCEDSWQALLDVTLARFGAIGILVNNVGVVMFKSMLETSKADYVRVNSIHPGGVNTVMSNPEEQPRAEIDKAYRDIPLQRISEPEEVARVSLFLASDDASYVTGEEIKVDGGLLVGRYYDSLPGAPDKG